MLSHHTQSSIPMGMDWTFKEFEIQPSLWRLIEEFVAESERNEVKEVLGEGLVDETVELCNEAASLLEIWQEYHEETDKEEREYALNRHLNRLPEPPLLRENLKKEIQMFVVMLQQRAEEEGRKVSSVLTEHDSSIVDYVLEIPGSAKRSTSASSRPPTASSSRDGRQTPMRATPSSDGSRCTSSMSDHLESMNDKLNALEIDRITDHLRGLLLEEKERLADDIAFLQESLLEESDYRQQVLSSPDPEPSLKDLRELGTKLEKELLNNSKTVIAKSRKHKRVEFKPISLDESLLNSNKNRTQLSRKAVPPVPKPPTSPPASQRQTALQMRGYTVTSSSVKGRQFTPSPPESAKSRHDIPSPPSSAKPLVQKPGSASRRFRKMVVGSRDSTQ